MLRSNIPDQMLEDALPVLDALIYDEHNKYPDYIPQIFNMKSTNRWGEQTTTIAGPIAAALKNEGEPVTQSDPLEGYDKTYQPLTYGIMVSFSKELIKDDRMDMVSKTYKSLGLSMYQTRQVVAFNILNNGFSDTGPDGSSLFNATHSMVGGHTYGNRPSVDIALSIAGIREMEVDLMRQVNHRNINVALMPETFTVPPELMQTLDELVDSPDRPDTANRATNTFYGNGYKKVRSPYLTSTTAWFVFSSPSQHELRFYDRQAPETITWIDNPTGTVNTKCEARFTAGYSDFVGAWGTSG